jgi:chemotaxis response regulator CheB
MGENGSRGGPDRLIRVLVVSQHEMVRRQLVAYLDRAPALLVSGDAVSADTIRRTCPDVLVLDLSQVDAHALHQVLDAARSVDARLIALASIHERSAEHAVVEAGGLYRLKSAGPDGLAEAVRDAARYPLALTPGRPCSTA